MEEMGLMGTIGPTFWRGKRVLVTGHTGFKGSWLCLWLQIMEADLFGLALPPETQPNLFTQAQVADGMISRMIDIRDLETTKSAIIAFRPEIIFHLAAQALVKPSYAAPIDTFMTNAMGTAHVLEAARAVPGLRAIVNVTTDKCYENQELTRAYREDDILGGYDPYSASKACSEIITAAYRRSFLQEKGCALATARAGNAIGGGDWSPDRLIQDTITALEQGQTLSLRNPNAVRPWQHVLEPLAGYLLLAERLYREGTAFAESWNFGPNDDAFKPVSWVVSALADKWSDKPIQTAQARADFHETQELRLDISKARQRLGFEPRWSLATTLEQIVHWHKQWRAGLNPRTLCINQIRAYNNLDS